MSGLLAPSGVPQFTSILSCIVDILQNYVWYNIAKLQEVTIVYVSKSRINDAGLTLVYLIIY